MGDFVSKRLAKSIRKLGQILPAKAKTSGMEHSLFDPLGRRKYLVPLERARFLQAALDIKGPTGSFCAVLAFTGARLSEVLAITPEHIDQANSSINFRTLKQFNRCPTRAVPVPRELIVFLDCIHHFREAQSDPARASERLWTWSRTTGWRRVKAVMKMASAPSFVAKPKALRHAFGVEATMESVALTMVQRWLGHRDIKTTTIYTTAVGREERELAKRTWRRMGKALKQAK
jgi:integrase/recombinase XerD